MRWPVAHRAEVVGRSDQTLAKVMLPDTVDKHASREGILRAADRLGQFESSIVGIFAMVHACQRLQEPPRHCRARLTEVAADENVRLERLATGANCHRSFDRCAGFERGQFLAKL